MSEGRSEIRCICGRKPLLAVYGVDAKGEPFIHMRVYKASRIYGEIFVSADAEVKIRCRECLRLQKIRIVSGRAKLEEEREQGSGSTRDARRVAPSRVERLG